MINRALKPSLIKKNLSTSCTRSINLDQPKNLDITLASREPIGQFKAWYEEAKSSYKLASAVCLSTASMEAVPSSRMVDLFHITSRGLVFCVQDSSRSGVELKENPKASLLFFWPNLKRQVRVEGSVERLPDDEANSCFNLSAFNKNASSPWGGQLLLPNLAEFWQFEKAKFGKVSFKKKENVGDIDHYEDGDDGWIIQRS